MTTTANIFITYFIHIYYRNKYKNINSKLGIGIEVIQMSIYFVLS